MDVGFLCMKPFASHDVNLLPRPSFLPRSTRGNPKLTISRRDSDHTPLLQDLHENTSLAFLIQPKATLTSP